MTKSLRPLRLRVRNELGQMRTLMSGPKQYLRQDAGSGPYLCLGLGPNPTDMCTRLVHDDGLSTPKPKVYYIESEDTLSQWTPSQRAQFMAAIPGDWTRIKPDQITQHHFGRVYAYQHGMSLFPSFWGPLWANLLFPVPTGHITEQSIALVGDAKGLLVQEIHTALHALGLNVHRINPEITHEDLNDLLANARPRLFLSVNFQGFDDHGLLFERLTAANIPCATWCVDNPFHLISRLKAPYWKRLHLFITDSWFLAPLKAHGAEQVYHLPLAVDPSIFHPGHAAPQPSLTAPLFVGRSAFPGKDAFFAGCRVPDNILRHAEDMIRHGTRPDFDWWMSTLGQSSLWPGKTVRTLGFAAETASLSLRTAVLSNVSKHCGLTVIGDEGWHDRLPHGTDLRPPVDYYGALSSFYEHAPITLNLTSLLLPHGLTQRHFDVFASGGLLVTDNTPGLSLFPKDLTHPITFSSPDQAPTTIQRLLAKPSLCTTLREDWKTLLFRDHTYTKRLQTLFDTMSIIFS
ncbi:glycosyltransferase family protein [Desulfovibrio inopinatus]|uniref:glycosyltransferase family protein n=1 Tax=Desulfovibrio inopinatus TaxID=102109 RepID=UPI00048A3CD3|nr:glycosyltransferase [Desulfovibrio inopinatus]